MSENRGLRNHLRFVMVIGSFLLNLPLGVVWYYGNLSTYVNSYLLYEIGPTAFNIQPDWLLSAFIICYVLGILTVDWLRRNLRSWLVELIGVVVFNLGTFLTYLTVQHSTALMLITFMICTGYAAGVVGMMTLINVRNVMPKHVGFTSAVVCSAFGLGAIVNNYVITAYINPNNLTPDVRQYKMAYFSQADVLDSVPGVFVITGLLSSVYQFLGYLLEQVPLLYLDITEDTEDSSIQTGEPSVNLSKRSHYNSSQNSVDDDESKFDFNDQKKEIVSKNEYSQSDRDTVPLLKPLEVLWERSLHVLWLNNAALTYGIIFTQTFYKLFGQLWIKNDAFLTSVGSFVAVSNAVCRIIVGFALDRIGVKRSLILVMSVNSILFMFWYITPILNCWLYFFCCQFLAGFQGTIYILFPVAALKLYGPTYHASNFGLILMANVVADLVSPVIFSYLQDEYGWFSMVLVGSVLSTVALVSAAFLMPEDRNT